MFIRRLIQALGTHNLHYALVGGHAVALHGAIRGTMDVDIAITLDKVSFEKCEKAMHSLGLQSRLPVTAKDVFMFREEYIQNRNLIAWSFYNPDRPIEIVDVLITEDAKKIRTVVKSAFKQTVHVASIPDLIRMKKKSGRTQDIEDIKALEKLEKNK